MMRFLEAVLLLSGMIIGVGMFAIPFSFVAAGFWLGAAELAALAAVVLAIHLLYAEIVLATPSFHRMPGYIRAHLGRGAAAVSWVSTIFGTAGTLLAYLVVGSLFLRTAAEPFLSASGAPGIWAVLLAAGVAAVTLFPLRKEAAINGLLTVFEIVFLAGISRILLPDVLPGNLTGIRSENFFMPYGVLLFALSGASVIPDVVTVLGRRPARVRAAVIVGSLIPALLYLLFAYAVAGVTGHATTEEAIAGLGQHAGGRIAWWASVAGFLSVLTSYVALSGNFQALLTLDMRLPRRAAWLAASAVPVALYAAGFQDFIAIISAVGLVAFGVDGLLFVLMGRTALTGPGRTRRAAIGALICAVIVVGVAAELRRYMR